MYTLPAIPQDFPITRVAEGVSGIDPNKKLRRTLFNPRPKTMQEQINYRSSEMVPDVAATGMDAMERTFTQALRDTTEQLNAGSITHEQALQIISSYD